MRKVLITGGAGFIGLNLARSLVTQGIRVDLLDDFSRGREDEEFTALVGRPGMRCLGLDLSAPGSTDGLDTDYDAIFHLAAILGVAKVIDRSYDTLRLNVQLTIEAIRLAAKQQRLDAFVFASTSEVYAGSLRAGLLQFPTPEASVIALPPLSEPRTSYMLSKLYGEALALQSRLPTIIVRPHNVYGPRMGTEHVVPELMKRMSRAALGEDLPIFSPHHSRTFCYIDDAVEIMTRLCISPAALGGVWNVGTEAARIPDHPGCRDHPRRYAIKTCKLDEGQETAGSPVRRCPSAACTERGDRVSPSRVPAGPSIAHTYVGHCAQHGFQDHESTA